VHEGGRQESTRIGFCFGLFPRTVLGICCFSISNEYVRTQCRFLNHHSSDEQLEELGIRSLFRNEVDCIRMKHLSYHPYTGISQCFTIMIQ
jgi:hypothetical protein